MQERINNLLNELKNNSSITTKTAILSHLDTETSETMQKIVKYAYDKDYKYGITAERITGDGIISFSQDDDINKMFELLDSLRTRQLTGKNALVASNEFYANSTWGDIFRLILDHDLKDGLGITTYSKIFPGLFASFSVALANVWSDKYAKKVDFTTGEWYASRKLDGVRCICIKKGDDVKFYARSGKPYLTLGVLSEEIRALQGDFVLDGECCIVDENGDEDFQSIIKEIKRKDHTIQNPCYMVFDKLSLEDFFNGTSIRKFSDRQSDLIGVYGEHIEIVEQGQLNSNEDFEKWKQKAAMNDWEGIMIRKDTTYKGKRSDDMLKVKEFHDAEYKVVECHNGFLPWVEDGKRVEYECLSHITIMHKGNGVSVGSGFSKEQRMYYYEHPEELIGKTVTVKYFQESQNQDGTYSLRFPTVKHIYKEDRDC